ncbi:hypothetical protein FJW04_09585 [Mesorhizobium sp. B2-7-3]|uniref:hypothetical protein n=1 Tax=Mesorhizobium sp. B2-7-3 TaxID=2589907 RepID=UPI00112E21B1|nr:hypothetical protein [Mesorhizobium sp. B2-7-3]TPJ17784.1 hypothetical protein FJW04_09585 [Mesorhizobium sp. B2-7-3]
MDEINIAELASLGTPELNYIGNNPNPYDVTVIALTRAKTASKSEASKGHVKLLRSETHLYHAGFVGIEGPELGSFTSRTDLIRALIEWASKNGWSFAMAHYSTATGQRLDVNPSAFLT